MPSRSATETVKMPDPDDMLSVYDFILKYQLHFTKYFGPKFAYGVTFSESNAETIVATARVRPVYQSIKGSTCQFAVPYGKFLVWRKNVKLYDFISNK